jgi:hypothetical protein
MSNWISLSRRGAIARARSAKALLILAAKYVFYHSFYRFIHVASFDDELWMFLLKNAKNLIRKTLANARSIFKIDNNLLKFSAPIMSRFASLPDTCSSWALMVRGSTINKAFLLN